MIRKYSGYYVDVEQSVIDEYIASINISYEVVDSPMSYILTIGNTVIEQDTDEMGNPLNKNNIQTAINSLQIRILDEKVYDRFGHTDEEARIALLPKTSLQLRIEQLESESTSSTIAIAEVYDEATQQNAIREQEVVYTMLGLAEAYELILEQQELISNLINRIDAIETLQGGGN